MKCQSVKTNGKVYLLLFKQQHYEAIKLALKTLHVSKNRQNLLAAKY